VCVCIFLPSLHLTPNSPPLPSQLCATQFKVFKKGQKIKNAGINKLIKDDYHYNWIVDNIPAAAKYQTDEKNGTTVYLSDGFPLGFSDPNSGTAYVNNHVNINIHYHEVEGEIDKYRVVRFIVEPFSINHMFEAKSKGTWDWKDSNTPVEITNKDAITACKPNSKDHMNWGMAMHEGVGMQVRKKRRDGEEGEQTRVSLTSRGMRTFKLNDREFAPLLPARSARALRKRAVLSASRPALFVHFALLFLIFTRDTRLAR